MAYSPEVYEVTAISFKKRLINSTLVGIPIVAIGLTSCLMAYKDKELTGILGGLLFFIAGCYLTRKIYTTKEKKEFKGIWEVMYEKNRMKNTLVALGMLGSILAVYIYSAHKQMLFNDGWWTYLIFVAIIARYLVPLWLPKRRFVLTSAALVEKQRQDNLNAQKSLENAKLWDDRMKRWWFRYPLAIAIAVAVLWLSEIRPDLWWLGVIAAIYALFLVREISLLILCIGAIYLVVKGVASLPVSVAIIIAALIIASAIQR